MSPCWSCTLLTGHPVPVFMERCSTNTRLSVCLSPSHLTASMAGVSRGRLRDYMSPWWSCTLLTGHPGPVFMKRCNTNTGLVCLLSPSSYPAWGIKGEAKGLQYTHSHIIDPSWVHLSFSSHSSNTSYFLQDQSVLHICLNTSLSRCMSTCHVKY